MYRRSRVLVAVFLLLASCAQTPSKAATNPGISGQVSRSDLDEQYRLAIQNAIRAQFLRTNNLPDALCTVHITQRPGGYVTRATVDNSCPYDEVGRKMLWGAVIRATPLPYQGFESVFAPNIDIQFDPR
jgi:colicin import membrane protein